MGMAGYMRIILKSFVDFFKDGGLMLAGSMSYFFMMALVPFCLLLVSVFGYFLGENEVFLKFFNAKLSSFFPAITQKITEELKKLISYKGVGTFTLMLYALLSYQLFSSLETAVNTMFKIKAKRPFAVSLLRSLLIVTLIIIIVIVSFAATSAISMLKELQEIFPGLKIGAITGFIIRFIVPFVLVFMVTTIMYKFLPLRKVRLDDALSGALFTTILLEAAKHIFTLYVVNVAKLGTVYGPLSASVIFLLWVFYSSCIFLIGAEVVQNAPGTKKKQ